jgi:hypothetical protein
VADRVELETALRNARGILGLGESVPARSYLVRRLDRSGEYYYLLVFVAPDGSISIAAANAHSGAVESSASGLTYAPEFDASAILRQAGVGATDPELVWQPGSLSRSPLYPFWAVRLGAAVRYVDWNGTVSPNP